MTKSFFGQKRRLPRAVRTFGLTLLALVIAASAGLTGQAFGYTLDAGFDSRSYVHNREFVGEADVYAEGETFFGQNLALKLVYKPIKTVTITGGVFMGITFGAESDDRWDSVAPVFTFDYQPHEDFSLTFGNLSRDHHTFMLALFDDVIQYQRLTETGFEIMAGYKIFRERAWINWQELNMPSHREKFDVGSITTLDLKPLVLDAQLHYIHRGGQLYDFGPVADNTALALGGTLYFWFFDEYVDKSGLRAHWLYSNNVADRLDPNLQEQGYGGEVTAFVDIMGWEVFASYWVGDGFYAEDGHPFYKADNFFKAGFDKVWTITDWIKIRLGFTGYAIDGTFQHSERLLVDVSGLFHLLP